MFLRVERGRVGLWRVTQVMRGRARLGVVHCDVRKLQGLIPGLSRSPDPHELTPENWESETAGKTVFIKFQATHLV